MEKHLIHNPRVISKRNFLAGAGSAATMAVMTHSYLNYETDEPEALKNEIAEKVSGEETFEAYNELSDSGYFDYDVERFTKEFALEVDEVLENREIYAAIQKNFHLPNIDHPFLRQQLEVLAPAIGFAESRYKDALSEVGAFGVMQLMPGTWEELSKEGEDITDVVVQVKVAARLMEQAYQHVINACSEELAMIEENFFGGDTKAFQIEFFTPLCINCYNAGMGSMETLVTEFAKLCPAPTDTVMLFEQSEILTGYDVFIGMAHTGNLRGWADWYKNVAANYTCKVYGAHKAVAEYFAQQKNGNS
jgi:phosphoenolpyruvate synthase/pyruvate phosphate dikinase